ncbi:hypothetical protein [Streptosporangium amethystogenes]|uniref:hypothetical protein n=1 Tax=Streptosporangium amethystogenes TaxID=2002 RepID=UPI0004CB38CD|nr:hypothetical protein [Streptosporangium amethystogenes]
MGEGRHAHRDVELAADHAAGLGELADHPGRTQATGSEAAQVLGIPYEKVMQVAFVPLAYTIGTDFKPARRVPMEEVTHWDRW